MAQLFLVQADLSENQRERLISSMTLTGTRIDTTSVSRSNPRCLSFSAPPTRDWRIHAFALADILEDERYPKGTKLSKWALYLRVIWKMKNIGVFKGHLKTVKQGMPQSWHSLQNTWHTAATKKDKHIV